MTNPSDEQLDMLLASGRDSLAETERSLATMRERLDAILDAPRLTEEALVEITAILNNVSYVFLYLEANNDHISYEHLLPWREAFYKKESLDARILSRLRDLKCSEPSTELSRRAYIRQLEDKHHVADPDEEAEMTALRAQARAAEFRLAAARVSFLERLGTRSTGRPSAAFFRLVSRAGTPALRAKLARAWYTVSDEEAATRAKIVDRMVALRHRSAARKGAASPLSETFGKCRVAEEEVGDFLGDFLECALAAQETLERALIAAYGETEVPFSQLGHFMRARFGRRGVLLFDLEGCLDYAFRVASSVFGLDFSTRLAPGGAVIVAEVSREGRPVGRINFDLWRQNGREGGANHTLGLRNRTEWRHVIQRPEAYVACRFARAPDGGRRITFQNVHSLLHEFGHAINHLLMREHLPNCSGLEYLPLERLEFLSMWSEKWVFHRSFADVLGLGGEDCAGLALCQAAKKIEYVSTFAERALTAIMDFECHRRPGVPLRQVYDRLDRDYRIGRFVRFADIPQYFSWPMYIANPGANFSYLFGAAWSVEAFLPFESFALGTGGAPVPEEMFDPCLAVRLPSKRPDPECLARTYFHAHFVEMGDFT